jgi:hypothetical protein
MRVDPQVTKAKFARQVEILKAGRMDLQRMGCYLVRDEFPEVDILILPLRPLCLKFSAWVVTPEGLQTAMANQKVFSMAGRPFGVRLGMDDYDIRPPSLTFCDPATWENAGANTLPQAVIRNAEGQPQPVLVPGYPGVERPFLCVPSTREYHEHPQHSDDSWLLRREGHSLFDTIRTIWQTFCVNTAPEVHVPPPTPGWGFHPTEGGK